MLATPELWEIKYNIFKKHSSYTLGEISGFDLKGVLLGQMEGSGGLCSEMSTVVVELGRFFAKNFPTTKKCENVRKSAKNAKFREK